MALLLLLAPLFFVFEIWQLVISERYLGLKQIARHGDPRALNLHEFTAFCWTALLFAEWLWMATLLIVPFARLYALALIAVSALGYSARRNTGLKWVLVILTFEGAIRIGLLVVLTVIGWRRL